MIFQRTALAAALGAALMAAPLRAEPPEAGVIAQLQALGYENFSVSRTLLGRVRVVAEGIEREEQVATLIAFGCEHGQGYLFSEPLNAADAERLLVARRPPWARERASHRRAVTRVTSAPMPQLH